MIDTAFIRLTGVNTGEPILIDLTDVSRIGRSCIEKQVNVIFKSDGGRSPAMVSETVDEILAKIKEAYEGARLWET